MKHGLGVTALVWGLLLGGIAHGEEPMKTIYDFTMKNIGMYFLYEAVVSGLLQCNQFVFGGSKSSELTLFLVL